MLLMGSVKAKEGGGWGSAEGLNDESGEGGSEGGKTEVGQ